MASSSVMTVRIDPDLLAALRKKARQEGRSVSAEVVRLIRRDVEARPIPRRRHSGFGMFRDMESVDIAEIRALRREVTLDVSSKRRPRTSR